MKILKVTVLPLILLLAVSCDNQNLVGKDIIITETVSKNVNVPVPSSTQSTTVGVESQVPKIVPSTVVNDLRLKKQGNPNITAEELAKIGNEIIKTKGLDFSLDPCEYKQIINNRYTLKTLDAKKSLFEMSEANGHPCGCTFEMPVLKINNKEMHVIVNKQVYPLKRPKEFAAEEFVLVDESLKKTIRKWSTPIDATPFGISADGTKVYYEFDFDDGTSENSLQVQDLVVEIAEDGTLRFVPEEDSRIIKGKELDGYPRTGEISYRRYNVGDKSYIVKFSYPCT